MVYAHDSEGLFTKLKDSDDNIVDAQYPLATDGDSVYAKDVDCENSDMGDFSGTAKDLFNSRFNSITNTTSTNPKIITIQLKRPLQTNIIGLGTTVGDFSNTVMKWGLIGTPDYTIIDESADSTKKSVVIPEIEPLTFSRVILEFHTSDTVTLSSFSIAKALQRIARIQGSAPDGTVKNINATQTGNLKTSLEEFETVISTNEKKQLNVSIYDSYGNIVNDGTSDALVTISHAHHEVHDGDHYYIEGYAELDSGVSLFVKLVTPDTAKWAHFEWAINSSLILTTKLTEAPTGGMTGGATATPLNSDRNSTQTAGMVITKGVTACTGGTVISEAKWGSRSSGGIEERGEEIILKQNTTYCREFTSGSNSNIVSFKASWYEHTDKTI